MGPRAPAKFGAQLGVAAAVVGLDLADAREHLPLEPEPLACLLVENEVVGRDAGDRSRLGHGHRGNGAGARENADRAAQDDERDELPGAADGAAVAEPAHQ